MCESRPGELSAARSLSYPRGAGLQRGGTRAESPPPISVRSSLPLTNKQPENAHFKHTFWAGCSKIQERRGGGGAVSMHANQRLASLEQQPDRPIRSHGGPSCIFLEAVGYSQEAGLDSPPVNCQIGGSLCF